MYIVTIIKTEWNTNEFHGFLRFSEIMVEVDLISELFSFNIENEDVESIYKMKKLDRKMFESVWKNCNIFITIFKM
jgi:hypothetical protein